METILKAEHVKKIYNPGPNQVQALADVNLSIEKGRFYAVIGRSGSGKSTLLYVLSGIDKPTEGRVSYEGKDLAEYSDGQMAIFRRRYMGFVFQQYNLMEEYNVLENICMPVKLDQRKVDPEFLHTVLETLGLLDKQKKYAWQLSGGEQQRVAIARSILAKPKIIFADEPTGNLDKRTAAETLELLIEGARRFGQTLVVVTHDLEVARMSEKIIEIEDGRIGSSAS